MRRSYLYVLPVVLSFSFIAADIYAMPGFARKYRMSCTTCHAPFPRLKDYGDEFAGNGFRLPEGEPRRATVDTGDPMLQLVRDIPIGFRMDVFGSYETEQEPNESDFKTPYNLKIISGAPIGEKLSYYFYFFFSEKGEVEGIEDAFLYFRDVFGTGVNFTAGQFAVSDPLFKNELRLSFEKYVLFEKKPPRSYANLMYDRGVILDRGFDIGLDLVLQVVNGNGIHEAEGAADSFDADNYKNVMFRASRSFGPFRIGGFTYQGREDNTEVPGGTVWRKNTIEYYGGDFTLSFDRFEFNGMYLERNDNNPYFEPAGTKITSEGVMAEALFFPGGPDGSFAVAALYNRFDSEYMSDLLDYETATLNLSCLVYRNVRFHGEYTRIMEDCSRGDDFEDGDRFLIGFVAGI